MDTGYSDSSLIKPLLKNQPCISDTVDWTGTFERIGKHALDKLEHDQAKCLLDDLAKRLLLELMPYKHYHRALLESELIEPHYEPCHWISLIEHNHFRVGLFTLFQSSPTPLHDHPGMFGYKIVLNGSLQLDEYNPCPNQADDATFVEIEHKNSTILNRNDKLFFSPTESNLHTLRALSDRCICLAILHNPADLSNRSSIFLPVQIARPAAVFIEKLPDLVWPSHQVVIATSFNCPGKFRAHFTAV